MLFEWITSRNHPWLLFLILCQLLYQFFFHIQSVLKETYSSLYSVLTSHINCKWGYKLEPYIYKLVLFISYTFDDPFLWYNTLFKYNFVYANRFIQMFIITLFLNQKKYVTTQVSITRALAKSTMAHTCSVYTSRLHNQLLRRYVTSANGIIREGVSDFYFM